MRVLRVVLAMLSRPRRHLRRAFPLNRSFGIRRFLRWRLRRTGRRHHVLLIIDVIMLTMVLGSEGGANPRAFGGRFWASFQNGSKTGVRDGETRGFAGFNEESRS